MRSQRSLALSLSPPTVWTDEQFLQNLICTLRHWRLCNLVLLTFLRLIITTWRTHGLVRWNASGAIQYWILKRCTVKDKICIFYSSSWCAYCMKFVGYTAFGLMTTSNEPLHLGMLNLVHDTYKHAYKPLSNKKKSIIGTRLWVRNQCHQNHDNF
jgi:hypothetical protein